MYVCVCVHVCFSPSPYTPNLLYMYIANTNATTAVSDRGMIAMSAELEDDMVMRSMYLHAAGMYIYVHIYIYIYICVCVICVPFSH